jgi:histidine triad (HIT) family protein
MDEATCIFCRIASGEIPARVAHEDDTVVAFHDLHPQAPLHVLVIPRRHIGSAADLTAADGDLLGRLFAVAAGVARDAGFADRGFRIVTNAGSEAGQSVRHLHFHVLAGRPMAWPPG